MHEAYIFEIVGSSPTMSTKIFYKYFNFYLDNEICYIIFVSLSKQNGALVQMARTFDLQSKGREFDSHMLHIKYFIWSLNSVG